MPQNIERVNKGFSILRPWIAGYIGQEMNREYGDEWWNVARDVLDDHAREIPEDGDYGTLLDSLDIANCLRLFDRQWNEIFRRKLSQDYRTWAKELMGIRNKTAHATGNDFDDDYAWRMLDTMSRLCDAFDEDASEEIRELARELRYGSSEGSKAVSEEYFESEESSKSETNFKPMGNLPSWRSIMIPQPDVAEGRYKNAEFAANLAQVAKGEGSFEYRDPVEFFSRTYMTEGMKGLLVESLKRVCGMDGEPVIQLKTAFGGGKTHSMLALYHMYRKKVPVSKMEGVQEVLDAAGVSEIPDVHIAVLVGTALDPSKSRRPANMPGITINTLWGEMAAQLAASKDDLSLYDYVKEADKRGVSPGAEALRDLFDACGSCVILIDELVAYARKLYGVQGLPAGSYGNLMSFVQEISEAASTSKSSLVVASIPESEIETGGDEGREALETIEHTFGRMEAVWKPVSANEGFEVVRRRLFVKCSDPDARDYVCDQFSQFYLENAGDFPTYAREVDYKERMISCYPIHPEIFDHLYQEWSTLERFQRTRGVLRLMAAVIHELWVSNDTSPMIMPGSIPMDVPVVRDELTRYLPEEWNGIVDSEVDGKKSIPFQKDNNVRRYGSCMACRRIARTIMLGSAPSERAQTVRGIEASRIRLGTVQPGDNIPVFNDALNTLYGSLSYLYTSPAGDRYWYDTRPTLRKTMEDRASQVVSSEIDYEINRRLKTWRIESPFAGLHTCPASSLDVPDEKSVRLVILSPQYTYNSNTANNDALKECENILNTRGNTPRMYKNMLIFLAPDYNGIQLVTQEIRRYLAWKSIDEDKVELNLDASQNRETEAGLRTSDNTVNDRLKDAYCWMLAPYIDLESNSHEILWEENNIRGGDESPIAKVRKKLEEHELLITHWAPSLLLMELDKLLWKDANSIQIKKLWEEFCTYCYLPRLASFSVLKECIENGVNSDEYFAYAEAEGTDRFIGLKYNTFLAGIDEYGYLVKLPVAMKQIISEQEEKPIVPTDQPDHGGNAIPDKPGINTTNIPGGGYAPYTPPTPVQKPKNTSFYLSTPLNIVRINKEVAQLTEEVINQLNNVEGSKVKITLEVEAEMPDGTPATVVRSVQENCQTLKVDNYGFED